ncbi:hypothetical protein R1sor_009145 [Riccia sorocarpa]|uniref:Uncharacterized protein n=1 Tax=Riccia sorocarpa TaxID=122646 RepID=A0ABD3H6U0_9MARC
MESVCMRETRERGNRSARVSHASTMTSLDSLVFVSRTFAFSSYVLSLFRNDLYLSMPFSTRYNQERIIVEGSRSDQSIGMPPLRRVRKGNGFRIDLEGMFLKPPTFAWFKFPLGTILEIQDLPENVVLYDRYQLVHGAFYLPPEFDMNNDLKILRQDRRGTRLTGRVTMPPGVRYTMIPENDVWYYVERPYTGEDFSAAFLTNEGMEFRFPAGSSLYMPNQR